jgi:hypothetical protein
LHEAVRLADVLTDEQDWAPFMSVEPIELPTSPNLGETQKVEKVSGDAP